MKTRIRFFGNERKLRSNVQKTTAHDEREERCSSLKANNVIRKNNKKMKKISTRMRKINSKQQIEIQREKWQCLYSYRKRILVRKISEGITQIWKMSKKTSLVCEMSKDIPSV